MQTGLNNDLKAQETREHVLIMSIFRSEEQRQL